jgi:hypothetical protein
MEINTLTRTRATTSSSQAVQAISGWRLAADARTQGDNCALLLAKPAAMTVQGGAIAEFGMAPVTSMVFDHTYSTRPGPSSCSPPV